MNFMIFFKAIFDIYISYLASFDRSKCLAGVCPCTKFSGHSPLPLEGHCMRLNLKDFPLPLHQRPTPTMPGALFFFTRTESIWRLNCWTGSKTIEKMTGSPSGVATFIPVLSTCESIGSCKQRTEEGIKTSLESNHWWWTLLNVAPGCICHPLHYFR